MLTNWYVRRSRDRFWAGDDADAFDTLYTVLETVARLAAPLLPLVTEELWRGLTGERSVHLADWPDATAFPADHELVATMDRVREIASSGLALRKARGLRVRLPLARLTVVSERRRPRSPSSPTSCATSSTSRPSRFEGLRESSLGDYGITRKLTVNARALGPRIGKDVQRVIQAAKAGDWSQDAGVVTAGGVALETGEYELELEAADPQSAIAFLAGGGFVILDTALTAELEAEGLARDVVRAVQQARKDAGLEVSDRIALRITGDAVAVAAIEAHRELIAAETLATSLDAREAELAGAGAAGRVGLRGHDRSGTRMTYEPVGGDGHFQAAADAAYAELLARIGEATPQPRLEPTRRAVELLGDPQRSAPIIHITGTNGKTSTSRMIESLLRATGLRTGLLTSPHLLRVNERILLDGEQITNEAFARNWDDIRPYLLMVDAELVANGEEPLTFFEALTVLAFATFADAPVDVMVIEVGMGGEWDSTNVADGQVAVFTPIALDHTARLGRTVTEIARTKSGIIKPAATVVSAIQTIEALDELRAAAQHNEAQLAIERVDFALESTTVAVGGQLINVRGRAGEYSGHLPAALRRPPGAERGGRDGGGRVVPRATGTLALDPDVVGEGLGAVTSPGRLQLVGIEPTVLVDAAHNPHGAAALAAALTEYFDFDEFAVVIGVLGDKDAHGIVAELAPLDRSLPCDAVRFGPLGAGGPARRYRRRVGRSRRDARQSRMPARGFRGCAASGRPSSRGVPSSSPARSPWSPTRSPAPRRGAGSDRRLRAPPPRRAAAKPRRRRSTTESLLSIVLILEASLMFFATLTIFGLKALEPLPAFRRRRHLHPAAASSPRDCVRYPLGRLARLGAAGGAAGHRLPDPDHVRRRSAGSSRSGCTASSRARDIDRQRAALEAQLAADDRPPTPGRPSPTESESP